MPRKAQLAELSQVQQLLVGTWTNQNLPGTTTGDKTDPYSYNVMPLPQKSPQNGVSLGYILKNFTYYETIVFKGPEDVASPVAAPNRSDTFQQTPFVVFYDQQIRFAEGPLKDHIVHEENGAWLSLTTEHQQIGPYPYPPGQPALEPGDVDPQPPTQTLCKQISVPHGVSVVALGTSSEVVAGPPMIDDLPSVLPTPEGLATLPYPYGVALTDDDNYQNPQPLFTLRITLPLQRAIDDLAKAGNPVTHHILFDVAAQNGGTVANIPFEQRKAKTTDYTAVYWLLSLDNGANYDILVYAQRILIDIEIGSKVYTFPHPTANVLTRVKV